MLLARRQGWLGQDLTGVAQDADRVGEPAGAVKCRLSEEVLHLRSPQ